MYLFILVTNLLYFMFTERWKPSTQAKRHPRVIDIINNRDLPACCYQLTHDCDNVVHTWVTVNLFIDSTESILFKYTEHTIWNLRAGTNCIRKSQFMPILSKGFAFGLIGVISLSHSPSHWRCMKKLKQEPQQEKRNEEIQIKSQETETPFCVTRRNIFDDKCSYSSFWRLEMIE